MSWIKRSSKVHWEKRRMKRACMRNGGSFPIVLLTITTWWRRGRTQAGQRRTWKSDIGCVPITRCFTIGCARKQVPRNLRSTSTRTKRSIWGCWHKTAFAPRLLLLLPPRQERRKRTRLLHRNLNCERQNLLCRNNAVNIRVLHIQHLNVRSEFSSDLVFCTIRRNPSDGLGPFSQLDHHRIRALAGRV